MKIGMEVQRLFRRKKHGMEIVALEIIRELQKMETKNEYVLFTKKDEDDHCIKKSKHFSIKIIQKAAYQFWEQLLLPGAVTRSKVDLLHCTSNTAPLICKIPLVITIHDVIYLESINFSGSAYQNFGNLYRRFIVPTVAKKAACILTVSAYEKKVIVDRLKIAEDKVRVVYNGVNKQFKPIEDKQALDAFRKKFALPEKFLLHFANTAPKKNTIGVLKAFTLYCEKEMTPLPLVLTDCSTDFIMDLLKEVNATALKKHILILDYIPFSDIPLLYNLATVFIYPSHRESFGMPLIEAMACGVPVITSNTSALPEIAGGAACLVDPAKPAELCEQIQHLLGDPRLVEENREKGFINARRFTWEAAARITEMIYDEIGQLKNNPAKTGPFGRLIANFKMHLHSPSVSAPGHLSKK